MPTIAGLAQQVEQAHRQQQGLRLPSVQAASRAQPVPASFAQQRLWFLQQMNPGQATYNIPLALRLEGQLNPAALQQSLQGLIDRHESLRTTLQLQGEQVVQCIAAHLPLRMPLIDLRELPAVQREEQARQLAQAEGQLPFDLAEGPLLRVTLLLLQSQEYVLLLNRHHCISDGWSNSVFQRELRQLYHAQLQGEMAMLPELPIQYADYALWQRSWLQGEVLEQQLAYWRQKLKRVATLNFPTDYPRPSVPSFRGANHSFALPQQLTQALKGLSRQQDATLFMTLLAAFQTLLHQYTGQEDIVVGTDIANRTCVETEGLIGLFVNLLALRTDFHGNPSFHEVLTRVRETVLGAYMHQDIPFEILVDALQPDHPLDRMPLVQVLFVMQNTPKSYGQLPGLTVNSFGKEVTSSKFDMALFVSEDDQGMRGNIIYSTDLFEEHSIVRLSQNFVLLLQEVVDMPENAVNATKTHRNVDITEQHEDTEQYENYLRKMKFSKRAANN